MRRYLLALPILLAACGGDAPDAEADQTAIDAVEAANDRKPPLEQITLQAIGYPDMEKLGIFGASCAFAPNGGGFAALFLGMAETGYFKFDGEVIELAADAGSAELPYGAREHYVGKAYSARFTVSGEGEQSGEEVQTHKAKLTIFDAYDRALYEAEGSAQCGA